jgi:hypothetical protein
MGAMYLTSGGFETAGASGGAVGDPERRRRLAAGRDGIGNGNPGLRRGITGLGLPVQLGIGIPTTNSPQPRVLALTSGIRNFQPRRYFHFF